MGRSLIVWHVLGRKAVILRSLRTGSERDSRGLRSWSAAINVWRVQLGAIGRAACIGAAVFGVHGGGAAHGQVMEIVSSYRVVSGSVGLEDGNLLVDSANTTAAGYWTYNASGLAFQESTIDSEGFTFLGMAQTAQGANSAHGLSLAEFTFRLTETVRWRAVSESTRPLATRRLWRLSDDVQLFAGVNWQEAEASATGVIGPGEYRLRVEMFLVNAGVGFEERFDFGIEPVPGPGAWVLMACGLVVMGAGRKRDGLLRAGATAE